VNSSPRAESRQPLVLVADDEQNVRRLIELSLQHAGFRVRAVESAALAVYEAITLVPDVILLNVRMPGSVDGYEACRLIKSHPATSAVPVVFLSAYADLASSTKGLSMGADSYLTKPFRPAALAEHIWATIARHQPRGWTGGAENRASAC
jgi:DNA-binding response OmpR family regulator